MSADEASFEDTKENVLAIEEEDQVDEGEQEEFSDEDYQIDEVEGKAEEENEGDDNDEEKAADSPSARENNAQASNTAKPSGRGISGFMLFVKEMRHSIKEKLGGKGAPTVVTKEAGELWRSLSDEERAEWNKRGKAYVVESTSEKQAMSRTSAIPLSKIRDIAKLDPEVHNISGQALRIMHGATELFASELAQQALDCGDRKRIRLIDVHHMIHSNDTQFGFLAHDFVTPATLEARESRRGREKSVKTMQKSKNNADIESKARNAITAYFAA